MKKLAKSTLDRPKPLNAGVTVGRYRIMAMLAGGGFGTVYRAQRDDNLTVALKEFIPPIAAKRGTDGARIVLAHPTDSSRFEKALTGFFHEADTLIKLHEPSVVAILDVFRENGTAYLVMPLERGHTFYTWARSVPWVSDAAAVRAFIQAARGVAALHACGLLHLDIKTRNLWLRPDGSAVVLDLGTARWHDEAMRQGHMARTHGFAAPEQYTSGRSQIKVDARTDVYGLAAALRDCLERRTPPTATSRGTGEGITKRMCGLRNQELLDLVDCGMSLDPDARPANAAIFARKLEQLTRLRSDLPRRIGAII